MPLMPDAYRKCTDCLPISMFPSAHQRAWSAGPGGCSIVNIVRRHRQIDCLWPPPIKRHIRHVSWYNRLFAIPAHPGNGNDSVPYDLRLFATSRSNCLLIGPDALVDDALTALQPFFRHAPVFLDGRHLLELPSSSRAATFVVRHVGELNMSQQKALSSWIESAPSRVQVVSTSAGPIWPAVEGRPFLASLYYRLNTMTISLGVAH